MSATETAKGTTYVVLRMGEPGEFKLVQNVVAASDRAAIRQVAKEGGTYIAVPTRSFKATKVHIAQQTVVEFG